MLDDPLVQRFEAATVDPAAFHHREHLYVAFCYLRALPLEEALARFVKHVRKFAERAGAPQKYHATVTWAYLVLLHEAMHDSKFAHASFDELLAAYPALLDSQGGILFDYYDKLELASDAARRHFVLPRVRRRDSTT